MAKPKAGSGANPTQPQNYVSKALTQFENTGHPGLWYKSVAVLNTTTDFTGSNFGAGAIFVTAASTNATASLSGGGTLNLGALPVGIHELSVSQVENNDAANTVYVLYAAVGEGGRV